MSPVCPGTAAGLALEQLDKTDRLASLSDLLGKQAVKR